MNVTCPTCLKALSIGDDSAGQPMKCPYCMGLFTAPALAGTPSGPIVLPTEPRESRGGAEHGASSSGPVPEAESYSPPEGAVFSLAPEPPESPKEEIGVSRQPPKNRGPRIEPERKEDKSYPVQAEHAPLRLTLNPTVTPWIVPVCAVFLFALQFFSWTGSYPGGHPVYTQSAVQSIWGGFTANAVGEKVVGIGAELGPAIKANMLMLLHFCAVTALVGLAFLPTILDRAGRRPSTPIERLAQHRAPLVFCLGAIGLSLALTQIAIGFGLPNGLADVATKDLEKEAAAAKTPEEIQKVDIAMGLAIGRFHVEGTIWRQLAILAYVVLLLGSALEWAQERAGRPLAPRLELSW